MVKATERDIDVVARTLFGEAEARNVLDAYAIAHVILNRCKHPGHWSASPAEVCTQPYQFSCWNTGDPNRERIAKASRVNTWFDRCYQIATEVLKEAGTSPDPTFGSTHYYETGVKMPKWAAGKRSVYSVSHGSGKTAHRFYNDIDTAPPENAKEALNEIEPLAATRTVKGVQTAAIAASASVIVPFVPLLQSIAEYAPIVLGIIVLGALLYVLMARISDRNKGIR